MNFAQLVDEMINAKKISRTRLAEIIGYDRKIFNRLSDYIPPKTTIIGIGVVFGFGVKEMNLFLRLAGYTLCETLPQDAKYIDVIQTIKGSGAKRFVACNEKLHDLGINEKYLLGKQS